MSAAQDFFAGVKQTTAYAGRYNTEEWKCNHLAVLSMSLWFPQISTPKPQEPLPQLQNSLLMPCSATLAQGKQTAEPNVGGSRPSTDCKRIMAFSLAIF